jgi:hypothetical protein
LLSNCLTEKGIREKVLKSAIKKLISKKFFSNEIKDETNLLSVLNEKYKEINFSNDKNKQANKKQEEENQNESNNKMEVELSNNQKDKEKVSAEYKNDQEPEKADTAVNAEDKQVEKIEANPNIAENINEYEKQTKMLNEIMEDIQNIDNVKNNLDNILENEAHMDLVQEEFINENSLQQIKVIANKKIEENKTNIEHFGEKFETQIVCKAPINEGNTKSINDKLDQEFNSKLDNYNFHEKNQKENENKKINMDIVEENKEKAEESYKEKEIEDLSALKSKLLAMEEKFSEYLKQYEKEWDSPAKRVEWVI